jgi:hypothetical protein
LRESISFSITIPDRKLCYNKRNPKKGIERQDPVGPAQARRVPAGVTTKEIPKRELRVHVSWLHGPFVDDDSYNRRNPKKGIGILFHHPAPQTAPET